MFHRCINILQSMYEPCPRKFSDAALQTQQCDWNNLPFLHGTVTYGNNQQTTFSCKKRWISNGKTYMHVPPGKKEKENYTKRTTPLYGQCQPWHLTMVDFTSGPFFLRGVVLHWFFTYERNWLGWAWASPTLVGLHCMHVCVCLSALIDHLPYIIVSGRSFTAVSSLLHSIYAECNIWVSAFFYRTESACIEKHK